MMDGRPAALDGNPLRAALDDDPLWTAVDDDPLPAAVDDGPLRAAVDDDPLLAARLAAFPPGEYVEQESFMRAAEIRELAHRAGIGFGTTVLDLCCGAAGPGRLIAREFRCDYLGVDASASAVAAARQRATGLPCRFRVARVPPLPPGRFDVILLLETILAFPDKRALLGRIAGALDPGGRFACTVEVGAALTAAERTAMPDSDTVWPIPLPDLVAALADAGLRVRWQQECTVSHRDTVDALVAAFTARRADIAASVGEQLIDRLLTGHRLWSRWLHTGRIRKFALVACKP
jgi:SAM-dependent methyltransferase